MLVNTQFPITRDKALRRVTNIARHAIANEFDRLGVTQFFEHPAGLDVNLLNAAGRYIGVLRHGRILVHDAL